LWRGAAPSHHQRLDVDGKFLGFEYCRVEGGSGVAAEKNEAPTGPHQLVRADTTKQSIFVQDGFVVFRFLGHAHSFVRLKAGVPADVENRNSLPSSPNLMLNLIFRFET